MLFNVQLKSTEISFGSFLLKIILDSIFYHVIVSTRKMRGWSWFLIGKGKTGNSYWENKSSWWCFI